MASVRTLSPSHLCQRALQGIQTARQRRHQCDRLSHHSSSEFPYEAFADVALGRQAAEERVFRRTLVQLADRIGSRLRANSKLGRTVTVRVRFANLNSVSRSVTLNAPISATLILAELAEELVRRPPCGSPSRKNHLASGDFCVASRSVPGCGVGTPASMSPRH